MDLEIFYELRTVVNNKITHRVFVDNPRDLYLEFKATAPSTKTYIFRTSKDENGNIVSSDKLNCKITNNSFILKTVYEKIKRVPKDSERKELTQKSKNIYEEVYDIALLEISPTLKRIIPVFRVSPINSGRRVNTAGSQSRANKHFTRGLGDSVNDSVKSLRSRYSKINSQRFGKGLQPNRSRRKS